MSKDLYEVLGLNNNSSDAEIKKAYRTLARKYHPDVNKEAGAETKFKDAQKAYEILSNPQKKKQYDQYGITDDTPGGGGAGGFGFDSGFGGFSGFGFEDGDNSGGFGDSIDDIFSTFFSGTRRSGARSTQARRGADLRYDLELTLEEAAKGVSKKIEIFHLGKCSSCNGSGSANGASKVTCTKCHGSGQIRVTQQTVFGSFSQVSTCPTCGGKGKAINNPCRVCQGNGTEKKKKSIRIEVPAGVDNGMKIRVSGEGNRGENDGPSGDLYAFVTIKTHPYFRREQNDIILETEIPYTKAILGTEIEVPTLEGKAMLKIPAGTQPNTVFRLKRKGIPHIRSFGKGDQKVIVKVIIPQKINYKEKTLVEELTLIRGDK
jgi:molecular chaperone DnaJ